MPARPRRADLDGPTSRTPLPPDPRRVLEDGLRGPALEVAPYPGTRPAPIMQTLLAALGLLAIPAALLLARTPDPEPSPDLSPADVVRIQVEALQHNDDPRPDAGIEAAFRFASPGNRAATGPLPRFARMVKGPVYGDMLGFERAEYGDLALDGDRAAQRVTLVQDDGRRVTYVFTLSRQAGGECDGCWMTDGVARRPPSVNGTTRV